MTKTWSVLLLALLVLLVGTACSSGDDDDDNNDAGGDDDASPAADDDTSPNDGDDDDAGPPLDQDVRLQPPLALVVTTADMLDAWQEFADWKNRTGLRTEVVLIEDILERDAEQAIALRDYLIQAQAQGVRYVLLGGDADQIPYIRGYTEAWALEQYYGNAPIETFYEALTKNWDVDGDGEYGELGDDLSVEDLRDPQIAVGRVPVETDREARDYLAKLLRYEQADGRIAERATSPLLMADLAAAVPLVGDIDGGMTHEQLLRDYLPPRFQVHCRRLYGTPEYAALVGAEYGDQETVLAAIREEGYPLIVTNTHGSFYNLTGVLSRISAMTLDNDVPFLFFTTSCLSGNFADVATGNGDNPLQTGEDSASEELLKNPDGGAVATVANTLIGLGPLGGVQFNHSLVRAILQEGETILGDAMINARQTLYREVAVVTVGGIEIPFPMDLAAFPNTEWYTQRSVLLLGDPTLRVWTDVPAPLDIVDPPSFAAGVNELTIRVTVDGEPAAGASVTLDQIGGVLLHKIAANDGLVEFVVKLAAGDEVVMTAWAENTIPVQIILSEK